RMILYPFQREAKEAVLRHWENGSHAALISLPTGSGKTIVFSDVLQSSLSGTGDRALVLVHRDELLRQAIEKLNFVWPGVKLSPSMRLAATLPDRSPSQASCRWSGASIKFLESTKS